MGESERMTPHGKAAKKTNKRIKKERKRINASQ